MINQSLRAPFTFYGGKRHIASRIWGLLGDVDNYLEPCCGSAAVLLSRPHKPQTETVNDYNCLVSNFWRSVKENPDQVAEYCEWPINECVPSGTMISTPSGPLPVEDIIPGMEVIGEIDGVPTKTKVTDTKESWAYDFVGVGSLWVTTNHPIWTTKGYLDADTLKNGDIISVLDRVSGKIDLAVLYSAYAKQGMDNLWSSRSQNSVDPLCGSDMSWEPTIKSTCLDSRQRRQNSSGLLDSDSDFITTPSNFNYLANNNRRILATSRKVLDFQVSRRVDKPYRWRGRNSRICSKRGNKTIVEFNEEGSQVFFRQKKCHVRKESFPRSKGKNSVVFIKQKAQQRNKTKVVSSSYWKTIIGGAPIKTLKCTQRKEILPNNYRKNESFMHEQKTSTLSRDGGKTYFNNRSSQKADGFRISCQSGNIQARTLQRKSLSVYIKVYNFQTATGNYFANGILVHNCDLHSRNLWLQQQRDEWFREKMLTDPGYYDVKIAGWWVWGKNHWIGPGWTISKSRQLPHLSGSKGIINRSSIDVIHWFKQLQDRLRYVRVCCGDWSRICSSDSTTVLHGLTGIFFDPPYSDEDRCQNVYSDDSNEVAPKIREYCKERSDDKRFRIVLAGYEGEHNELESLGWGKIKWKAPGGYGNRTEGNPNARRERLWYSRYCITNTADNFFNGRITNEASKQRITS